MVTYIGTSGWSYNHWQGIFYPPELPVSQRLDYYVQRYSTVELNSSYYHWPVDKTFLNWQRRLPQGFQMSVKAPGGLTHQKRLYEPEAWLARVRQGLSGLGDKLGVLLVQLPPSLGCDLPRLSYFLAQLPPDLRVTIEMRHQSWHQEATFQVLEQYGAAYCVMSGARLPCILRATAPFVYVRLHGPDPNHLYAGSYSDEDLRWWADRIREWAGGGLRRFLE
jgi:uncharacterized protein YecE (DUF72 family)